jgi:tetratricopeptide (TPR) repeat protein
VLFRLGDRRSDEMPAEAVELLEKQPAGQDLVGAYTYMSGNCALTGRYREAIAAAEQASALAAELGLPEPAFALHFRGLARCELGEAEGLEDMRRALDLALEQGLGRETAVIHNNLAGMVGSYEGPHAALDALKEAITFCERRGITEFVLHARLNSLHFMAELGQTQEALDEAGPLAARIQATGDIAITYLRGLQLQLHAERGTPDEVPDPDELVTAAREVGLPSVIAPAFVAAAQLLLAQGQPERARTLVRELDDLKATGGADVFTSQLPALLRVVFALDDPPLAERLSTGIDPVTPLLEHVLATIRAQLAEAAHQPADAAPLYEGAAECWREFGSVPEHAYALLGQGRCLTAVGDPEGKAPLREARELFASMGYRPALAETEALLGEAEAAAV